MSLDGNSLPRVTDAGLFCEQGNFFIDPWRQVERAAITHTRVNHLRCGYLIARDGALVTRARLNDGVSLQLLSYGELCAMNVRALLPQGN